MLRYGPHALPTQQRKWEHTLCANHSTPNINLETFPLKFVCNMGVYSAAYDDVSITHPATDVECCSSMNNHRSKNSCSTPFTCLNSHHL
jgi:hypothetical protein